MTDYTALDLPTLHAIRRAAQRLAELDYIKYAWLCDLAADVDVELDRRRREDG